MKVLKKFFRTEIIILLCFIGFTYFLNIYFNKNTAKSNVNKEKSQYYLQQMVLNTNKELDKFCENLCLESSVVDYRILEALHEQGLKITFTENTITEHESLKGLDDIKMPNTIHTLSKAAGIYLDDRNLIVLPFHQHYYGTIVHEIGHALDSTLTNRISSSKEFLDIWNEELHKVFNSPYYIKSSSEYFAEAFSVYYNRSHFNKNHLKRRGPKTYKFMKDLTENFESYKDKFLGKKVDIPDKELRKILTNELSLTENCTIYESNMKKIISLNIKNKNIFSLEGLQYAVNLSNLFARDNNISDISPLKILNNLKVLDLRNNKIEDISPISSKTSLSHLRLDGNNINDPSPLLNLKCLRLLELTNNPIEDKNIIESLKEINRKIKVVY